MLLNATGFRKLDKTTQTTEAIDRTSLIEFKPAGSNDRLRKVTSPSMSAWTSDEALRSAHEALARVGRKEADLELIRLGENAIFLHPDKEFIIRVTRPNVDGQIVYSMFEAARILGQSRVPVTEPADSVGTDKPLLCQGSWVTFWKYAESVDGNPSLFDFGRALQNLQTAGMNYFRRGLNVPAWRPFESVERTFRVSQNIGVPDEWLRVMEDLLAGIENDLPQEMGRSYETLIHGDAHLGNAINTKNGIVLADLDNLSIAPSHVDLIPTLVQRRRFRLTFDDWAAFAEGFNASYQIDNGSPLITLREISMTVWLMQQYGLSADIDSEIELRVRSLKEADTEITWKKF